MSFKKNLFKNILISGSYNYVAKGITFLSSIVIARLLSPENYGFVGLIVVFTGFISIFADGGISYALIRSDLGKTFHNALTNIAYIFGFSLFIITSLLAYPIALFYDNNELILPTIVLGTNYIIYSFSLVQGAILAKNLQFAYIGKVTVACTIATACTTIVLAYLGLEHWALIIAQLVGAVLGTVLNQWKVRLKIKIYPLAHIKAAFKHTRVLIGSVIGFNIINYWSRNADNLIVGKKFGEESLGIYHRAYTLLTLPLALITGLFSNILFPSLKKLKSEGGNIEDEYVFVLNVISVISFPLVVILILLPNPLVSILWGENWLQVATLLPYFGLLVFTQTLNSTSGQILVLQGKEKGFMISGWVSAVFLISGIVIGSFFSIKAIAQFYALSFILFVLPFNLVYIYIVNLKFNTSRMLKFWLPKIGFSIILWTAISLGYYLLQIALLGTLAVYLLWDSRIYTYLPKLLDMAKHKLR